MIKAENITFRYRENDINPALKNVSFTIEKGQYVAILGHNGSGKSTLSKLLVALLKPQEGSLSIDGIVYSKENLSQIRRKIGIIFQNPDNQFVGSSVEDDIAFGLENRCIPHDDMKPLILQYAQKVDMMDYLEREPESLSGGQKQRVAIASVLALNPDVVIFDEVTSMLDPKGKSSVLQIIKEIQESKEKTLISITHDMDEAILADKCLVFAGGELIASGSPKDILKNKEIIDIAKIESPFIYRISERINGINPTYNEKELIKQLCK
ncbi:energy-coupling factor transporter ATPase [Mycoplasmopsis verecunda]|uniref:Energy-coupling factor transport system ATP-binding protein n=1 Tax=Mycoplasmopsis verecunda TaxID=171291 RepID=A0A1T4LHX3_9BACT|nr:energy-coupling factor transporter ATPase [Mycoplasmopsis verecunda]WPB54603.1 energy-coupling factor transporter ATPase [Mycoplasmopsis verecunda]SJZ54290.1 energy-coupling factor transport system ATP-binding protein [Mycoplasmopsis verecunda]